MQAEEQKAILAIALHAAFADGAKDDLEREEVRRIAESLASASSTIDLRAIYQDVLLKRFTLDHAVAALREDALRHYAYEMALCVCEADGQTTASERTFLDGLKVTLGLGDAQASEIEREVDPFIATISTTSGPVSGSSKADLDQSILPTARTARTAPPPCRAPTTARRGRPSSSGWPRRCAWRRPRSAWTLFVDGED